MGSSRLSQIGTIAAFSAVLVFGFQNCGSSESLKPALLEKSTDQQPDLSQSYKSVASLSSEELSCSADADCIAVEYGVHGCGGPSGYAITSVHNAKLSEIRSLAQSITDQEENFWQSHPGLASTCDYRGPSSPPKCTNHQCVDSLPFSF
jgi:hypothetical protein